MKELMWEETTHLLSNIWEEVYKITWDPRKPCTQFFSLHITLTPSAQVCTTWYIKFKTSAAPTVSIHTAISIAEIEVWEGIIAYLACNSNRAIVSMADACHDTACSNHSNRPKTIFIPTHSCRHQHVHSTLKTSVYSEHHPLTKPIGK
jgi:hypothetical protein